MERKKVVAELRRLGKTMTQAGAARVLGLDRQWAHTLSGKHDIMFKRRKTAPKVRACTRCGFRKRERKNCLRCKWTPARIRKLRQRYDMSQVDFGYHILDMNVWAVVRWESGKIAPSRRALEKLEAADKREP